MRLLFILSVAFYSCSNDPKALKEFIQPENNQSSSINKNPLDGDLTFHTSSPLIVEHQEWKSSSWVTVETSTAESLSEAGGSSFLYIPCLNDRDDHIEAFIEIIEKELAGWI